MAQKRGRDEEVCDTGGDMQHYYVVSPEWGEIVPVTDEGEGPMEYACDVVEVEASNRADARVLGLKLLRTRPCYHRWHGYNSDNDFAGLKVEQREER